MNHGDEKASSSHFFPLLLMSAHKRIHDPPASPAAACLFHRPRQPLRRNALLVPSSCSSTDVVTCQLDGDPCRAAVRMAFGHDFTRLLAYRFVAVAAAKRETAIWRDTLTGYDAAFQHRSPAMRVGLVHLQARKAFAVGFTSTDISRRVQTASASTSRLAN